MNIAQLAKHQDLIYELRPIPISKTGTNLTPTHFNKWKVSVVKGRKTIQLRNISTGHQLDLGADNFREFQSPHFLILKCQLTVEGAAIHIEPLPYRAH